MLAVYEVSKSLLGHGADGSVRRAIHRATGPHRSRPLPSGIGKPPPSDWEARPGSGFGIIGKPPPSDWESRPGSGFGIIGKPPPNSWEAVALSLVWERTRATDQETATR